jgi:hypothetical protein
MALPFRLGMIMFFFALMPELSVQFLEAGGSSFPAPGGCH